MKKTLKLVGMFAGVLLVVVIGAVAGYYLIIKNKTYYIYDLRIVEPISEADTYVYVNAGNKYTSMKNQKVYMTTESENYIQIAAYMSSSTNYTQVNITSSDPSVARIIYEDGLCYINYIKAGSATITASHGGVSDSIVIDVYDQVAEEFSVYDYDYYGDYASYFPNKIIGYSDGITYEYSYVAYSASGENANDLLNNDLLRIDKTKLNTDVFDTVYIDGLNKNLVIKCKSGIESNIDEQIVIQSYTYDEGGNVKVEHNYVVNVHVVTYIPEFLQIVVSKSPDFDDGCVFMNTSVIDDSDLTEENILDDPDILDEYLSYKKAENNLVQWNEHQVYQTLFTDKVTKLYVKFRKVYTNGDMVYLNPLETSDHFTLTADFDYLKLAPTKDYYILTLTEDYYADNESFNITLSLNVDGSEYSFDLFHTFKFEFASLTEDNISLFYTYDETTGVYSYTYWDPRTRFDNEIYNENGDVVDFAF